MKILLLLYKFTHQTGHPDPSNLQSGTTELPSQRPGQLSPLGLVHPRQQQRSTGEQHQQRQDR